MTIKNRFKMIVALIAGAYLGGLIYIGSRVFYMLAMVFVVPVAYCFGKEAGRDMREWLKKLLLGVGSFKDLVETLKERYERFKRSMK